MLVKVLITRRIKQGAEVDALVNLSSLRTKAMEQPGYISGETLVGHDDPHKLVVISTWAGLDNWQTWKDDPDRRQVEALLEPSLMEPTSYEVFIPGARPGR
jgi:antibiotic biosynthesis monooxygenase (ABM) superfamily enzyme